MGYKYGLTGVTAVFTEICDEIYQRSSVSWANIYIHCSLDRKEGVFELRYKKQSVLTIDEKRFEDRETGGILTEEEIERVLKAITVVDVIGEMG
jgi:hypothetical protein